MKLSKKRKLSKWKLVAAAAALAACTSLAPVQAAQTTPVIVELFTSEGCSSCPPADTLLSQYVKSPVPGVQVIALGEHVDYWNHGGWADPFSAAQFSQRQSDYSSVFHLGSVYTPQMIVDGTAQFDGGDEDLARAAIRRAARLPHAQVSVAQAEGGRLAVHVGHLPASAMNDPAEVYLAVTEDGLHSSVGGGENAGRHLSHSAVVRELIPIGVVTGGAFDASPTVMLKPGWRRVYLHAVVFVQEQTSRRIVGASEILL